MLEMGKTFDAKTQERVIQIVYAVGGSLLFAAGVNLLITPLGLYNGGFMGFAQLLRTFVVSVLHVPVPAGVDLSGIIYFILNIPLFYMGQINCILSYCNSIKMTVPNNISSSKEK